MVATNLRHDSAGVLLALCAYATGALLATGQVGMLMHRYGGPHPSSAHLGDAQEISVSRPGVLTTLTPLATAGFVAVAFLLTADSRFASDRSALTLIVFGSVCSLWAGLDTIAAILTGRWERASGLGIYCPGRVVLRRPVGVDSQQPSTGRPLGSAFVRVQHTPIPAMMPHHAFGLFSRCATGTWHGV